QYSNACVSYYAERKHEPGRRLIVAKEKRRNKVPARYEDDLIKKKKVTGFPRRTLKFEYEILHDNGDLAAIGETHHVLVNKDGRPSSFPEKYAALLHAIK